MKVSVHDTNGGDVLDYEVKQEEVINFALAYIESKDLTKSVIVCFFVEDTENYRDEYHGILASHSIEMIINFIKSEMNESRELVIFECESYEDAFKLSIDLKEGV
jgi:hypothetical protein